MKTERRTGLWTRLSAAVASLALLGAAPHAGDQVRLRLLRLDCGTIEVDLATFSDTGLYRGERRMLASSCYLVQHGEQFLLWDTGLDGKLEGRGRDKDGNELRERLVPQLARIGVTPDSITFLGISHYHYDHTGQMADFPGATLIMGKKDLEVARSRGSLTDRFGPWLGDQAKLVEVTGDHDVFGDGRVRLLAMPGHTPGHSALLVELTSGPVLLSGDQYHFHEQVTNRGVPAFNFDRAQTLASHDRFDRLAANLGATVIIQHDPRDIEKLPLYPQAAE